jgi:hypothetical protein
MPAIVVEFPDTENVIDWFDIKSALRTSGLPVMLSVELTTVLTAALSVALFILTVVVDACDAGMAESRRAIVISNTIGNLFIPRHDPKFRIKIIPLNRKIYPEHL